jgi:ParB family chromosome partitioning protein
MSSKRKLGAGLSLLLKNNNPNSEISNLGDFNFVNLNINFIKPNPNQPRKHFDAEKIEELSESIKLHGLLQPIIVKKIDEQEYSIIAGERRYRAMKLAEFTEIPAIVLNSDEGLFQKALIENIQRENLNIIEEAEAYKLIIEDLQCTHEELSKKISKSRPYITNILRLLSLPDVIVEGLRENKISNSHAKILLSTEDPTYYYEKILEEKLSVRHLDELIKQENGIEESEHKDEEFDVAKILNNKNKVNDSEEIISFDKKVISDIQKQIHEATDLDVHLKIDNNENGSLIIKFKSIEELQNIIKLML